MIPTGTSLLVVVATRQFVHAKPAVHEQTTFAPPATVQFAPLKQSTSATQTLAEQSDP